MSVSFGNALGCAYCFPGASGCELRFPGALGCELRFPGALGSAYRFPGASADLRVEKKSLVTRKSCFSNLEIKKVRLVTSFDYSHSYIIYKMPDKRVTTHFNASSDSLFLPSQFQNRVFSSPSSLFLIVGQPETPERVTKFTFFDSRSARNAKTHHQARTRPHKLQACQDQSTCKQASRSNITTPCQHSCSTARALHAT